MRRTVILTGIVSALLLWCCGRAAADKLVLKDGTEYVGKKVGGSGGKIAFSIGGKLKWFNESDIAEIVKGPAPAAVKPATPKAAPTPKAVDPSAMSKGYPIRIVRVFKVGDELRVVFQGEETTAEKVSSGRKVMQDKTRRRKVELEADMKVLAVDAKGRVTRAAYTVRKFTGSVDGKAVAGVSAGEVLTAQPGPDPDAPPGHETTVIKAKSGPLSPEALKALDMVISVTTNGQPDEDAVFGSSDPRRPKQPWKINKKAFADGMAATGITVDPAKVTGQATIADVRNVGNVTCLRIEVKVDATGFSPPLPPGAKVVKSAMSLQLAGDFPVETSLPKLSSQERMAMTMQMSITQEGGAKVQVDMDNTRAVGRTFSFVDKTPAAPVEPPPAAKGNPFAGKTAEFAGEKITIELPEPCPSHVQGGYGRYFIFHLKTAKKLAILDILKGEIVKEIPDMPEEVRVAAGAEKMIVVLPSQKMLQRWRLDTFKREKVSRMPGRGAPRIVLMGCNSAGPLLLGFRDEALLVDIETMAPMRVTGKVLGATGERGISARVSPDGRMFTAITTGLTGQTYKAMRVLGSRTALGSFSGTSHATRWARPSADGSLIFLPGGVVYASNLQAVAVKWPKGTQCYATTDPTYFLAVHFAKGTLPEHEGKAVTLANICTVADRRIVYTYEGLEEMVPRGNTSARNSVSRRFHGGETRFHYVPQANLIVTLHWDSKQISIRKFNLFKALEAKGGSYLFVTSTPPTSASAGRTFQHQIAAASKAGGVTYKLETGPKGAKVSPTGQVRWLVPRTFNQETATLIISIKDAAGAEVLHTIDLVLTNLFRRKRP